MKKLLLLILCLVAGINSFSQPNAQANSEYSEKSQDKNAVSQFVYNDKVALKLDYFGELVLHPGLSMGIDYTLARKNWVTVHWDSELGGYWHRWNNTAVFLKSSIGARFPVRSLFVDLNVGAGYIHSLPAGTMYQISSEGGIEIAANWGSPHFMPTTSFLIGWDGTRIMNLPWTFHAGVEAYLQSSFNHIFLPHAAAKVGFTYKFKRQSL
ncbi:MULTISPECIES: hypothetical protein [unclassified Imperialibacter]|uniref:hypothetical protein n=1 Tax=unclassified Imperialibacter TaxID=2629706 RepID=UPI0012588AAA|nr:MULTISPECIES: hypothetical protein [unclassified Imperialibacter]CAD5254210.1 conserved exported hypothetical protein [Imperialibacter sp. 75]CAD5262647.1 conserved exported hypothetical protein [Imperialibacter sp. 89]VVT35289.1 conserved exported hypothetical protein [Imperialibacter sp. EC-SDR9]